MSDFTLNARPALTPAARMALVDAPPTSGKRLPRAPASLTAHPRRNDAGREIGPPAAGLFFAHWAYARRPRCDAAPRYADGRSCRECR